MTPIPPPIQTTTNPVIFVKTKVKEVVRCMDLDLDLTDPEIAVKRFLDCTSELDSAFQTFNNVSKYSVKNSDPAFKALFGYGLVLCFFICFWFREFYMRGFLLPIC